MSANHGVKLVRPQTDKMPAKLDDMVGGVGDVRDCGETSAEEDVEDEMRVEEARDALRRRPASRPTIEEIRRHRATHLPFRDWCPECIVGSANDWPHRRRGTETQVLSVPEPHCDYCFPKDHVGGDYAVVLVARDRETRMTVSHVVPVKGGDQEWVAEQLTRDILKLGLHGDLTLRSDEEPAIVDLLKQVAKLRGVGRTFLEQSPVGDSKANGVAERAVQSVEKMVRVHKLAFENRIGARLPVKHPLFAWLVEHVSDILNRFLVGRDGKTRCSKNEGEKLRTVCLGVWVRRYVSRLRKGGRSLYVREMVLWLLAGKETGHSGACSCEGRRCRGSSQSCARA